jgi:hypothetical protein
MHIQIDKTSSQVILIGAKGLYQARLNWSSALELGSQLQAAAIEIEPPPPAGRTSCPKDGRWAR